MLFDTIDTVVRPMRRPTFTGAGPRATVNVGRRAHQTGRKVAKDHTTIVPDELFPTWNDAVVPL